VDALRALILEGADGASGVVRDIARHLLVAGGWTGIPAAPYLRVAQ